MFNLCKDLIKTYFLELHDFDVIKFFKSFSLNPFERFHQQCNKSRLHNIVRQVVYTSAAEQNIGNNKNIQEQNFLKLNT